MGCACDNYNRHKQELARFSHHHHDDCNCNNHEDSCGCGHHHIDDSKEKTIFFIRIVVSALLLVLSMFLRGWFLNTTLIVSYVVIAYDIMLNAFKNIIKGKIFDENFLMLLASLTAIIVFIINPDSGIDGFDGVLVALLYQLQICYL